MSEGGSMRRTRALLALIALLAIGGAAALPRTGINRRRPSR